MHACLGPLIIMTLGDKSLEQVMLSERLCSYDVDRIKVIMKQILESVALLHDKGIIHGDLKPVIIVDSKSVYFNMNFDTFSPIFFVSKRNMNA